MNSEAAAKCTFAAISAAVLAGCHAPPPESVTEDRQERVVIEKARAEGAERITAEIQFAVGELRVSGGAKEFLEADFTYNVPSLKPRVQFEEAGFRRRLTISQGSPTPAAGNVRNRWEIRLGGSAPLDLTIRCGAGSNVLDLRQAPLRSLQMDLGVGEVNADLRVALDHDVEARINGGIGRAEMLVPAAGVEASAAGAIGQIRVLGLEKQDGRWRSGQAGKTRGRLRLEVKGGIGEIVIRAE